MIRTVYGTSATLFQQIGSTSQRTLLEDWQAVRASGSEFKPGLLVSSPGPQLFKAAGHSRHCRGWSSRLKVSYANPRAERIYCLPPGAGCAQGVDPHQALKGGKRELWSAIAANHDGMWPLGPSGLTSKALSRKFALA